MHPQVALHDDSGVIHLTQEDTGNYGLDGSIVDGYTIHRIYSLEEASSVGDFMQKYIWCTEIDWWKRVPDKPNAFAYWDGELDPPAWNWDSEILANEIRLERTKRLFESDWTQMPDSPLTTEQKEAWATYRQALRDLTGNLTGTEATVEDAPWPVAP